MKSSHFEKKDLDLISGTEPWPMMVLLTLKRYNSVIGEIYVDFGFLYKDHGWKVFRNKRMPNFLYDITPVQEDLASGNFCDYKSMEELIEDGWVVD